MKKEQKNYLRTKQIINIELLKLDGSISLIYIHTEYDMCAYDKLLNAAYTMAGLNKKSLIRFQIKWSKKLNKPFIEPKKSL